MPKKLWADDNKDFDHFFDTDLDTLVTSVINDLVAQIERTYPDSMIVYVLRNYTKCRALKALMI